MDTLIVRVRNGCLLFDAATADEGEEGGGEGADDELAFKKLNLN